MSRTKSTSRLRNIRPSSRCSIRIARSPSNYALFNTWISGPTTRAASRSCSRPWAWSSKLQSPRRQLPLREWRTNPSSLMRGGRAQPNRRVKKRDGWPQSQRLPSRRDWKRKAGRPRNKREWRKNASAPLRKNVGARPNRTAWKANASRPPSRHGWKKSVGEPRRRKNGSNNKNANGWRRPRGLVWSKGNANGLNENAGAPQRHPIFRSLLQLSRRSLSRLAGFSSSL